MEIFADYLAQILIFSIFAISLNMLAGYVGQVSVAQAAFGGVGGYTAALCSMHLGLGLLPALAIGVLAALLGGFIVGLPALNLEPDYLILLTLAASTMFTSIVSSTDFLGGEIGLSGFELPEVFGVTLIRPSQWLPVLAVFFAVVWFVSFRLATSGVGLALKGIREEETAARSLGKRIFSWKLSTFVTTAAVAGLAGVFLVYYNTVAAPAMFGLDQSMLIFAMVIVGGRGNPIGPVIGAVVLVALTPLLERVVLLPPDTAALVRLIIFGVGLILLIRLRPQGILPEHRWKRRGATSEAFGSKRYEPFDSAQLGILTGATPGTGQILEVEGLSKSFGGIAATKNLSLRLAPGKITALVGPNGAGKTTVFGLVTGALKPDAGRVTYGGQDITGSTPDFIARQGIVRSFQDVKIFAGLSALENVRYAFPDKPGEHVLNVFFRPRMVRRADIREREEALAWLDFVGLADKADTRAGDLSFGDQRLITLARTIASGARVLLLDEPTSGMDSFWVDRMIELILKLPSLGKTVCIVEHNLQVVSKLSDHVYFMELGTVTAEGAMAELIQDKRLTEVYFGAGIATV